ncbi:hypothetical protein [Pseudomonas putida]
MSRDSNDFQMVLINGQSQEDFFLDAYNAWLEEQISEQEVWPTFYDDENLDEDHHVLIDPLEKRSKTDDVKKLLQRFPYISGKSKSISPDSLEPLRELLPNFELEGDFRSFIDQGLSTGRIRSLTDISSLFLSKFDDAIRHRKYDPIALRNADIHFANGVSIFSKDFGKVRESKPAVTNSYMLGSAHPGIYKLMSGIFVADMNARLQSFILRALRTEDFSARYGDLVKLAYAAGTYAVDKGIELANSRDNERKIGRSITNTFAKIRDRLAPKKRVAPSALLDMSESHAILYGRRFKLRRGESPTQRLARYKKDYPVWSKQRIAELEKQHLKVILAVGFARSANGASVTDEHLKAADDLIKSAKKTPGLFSKSRDLIDISCGRDQAAADQLLKYFDPGKRRTELLGEVFSLGRTLSRVREGRKVIRAVDKYAGELLSANAILRSDLGVPSVKDVRGALSEQGFSVTDMLAGMKRKFIPGVGSGLKKGLLQEEAKIRSAAGKSSVGDLSLDDMSVAKDNLKKLLKARIAKTAVKSAKGDDAENLPKVKTPGRKPGDNDGEFKP